jgi:Protein of unknown function (DUF3396)
MRDLTISSEVNSELCIGLPCISLAMYSDLPLEKLARELRTVLESYLAFIPPGSIRSIYVPADSEEGEGYFLEFDRSALVDLLREISEENFRSVECFDMMLSGGLNGEATGYGARFFGSQLGDEDLPEESNLLRLDFALRDADNELEALVRFVTDAFRMFPGFTGNCGLAFNYTLGFESEVRPRINALVMRYIGFDVTYDFMNYAMMGKSPPAHWINFIGNALLTKLGGVDVVAAALRKAVVRPVADGVLIRGAARPPVGDVNRRARDIGALPSVARCLTPIRFDDIEKVGMDDPRKAARWLARFDELEDSDF